MNNNCQLPTANCSANCQLLIGTFSNDHDLLAATRAARERGFPIVDAYTPYPVHGLDETLGLRPSRLGVFCFACGAVGVISAMALQHWTMAIDWPINVGGRPFNSWPAFVPVAFELLVLFAGFGVVFAFLGVSRLFPGQGATIVAPQVSNDRFALVIEAAGEAANTDLVLALLRAHQAIAIETRENNVATAERARFPLRAVNYALVVLFAAGMVLNWTLTSDPRRPNLEIMPEMAQSKAYESFGEHEGLPSKMALQMPPPGTIPRGHLPMHYEPTAKDAERAGAELSNPFKHGDKHWQPRGAAVYANYCALCHGGGGDGDGPVSKRGVPPPPSLLADKARKMKDGQLFHVVTHGQGNMAPYAAQLGPEDRWATVLHVRQLQKAREVGK